MKNLKKWNWIPGVFAFVFALAVAFAFTRPVPTSKASAEGNLPEQIWIKYDCGNQGAVLTEGIESNILDAATQPVSGLFEKCIGSHNVCAIKYATSQTHALNPSNPNIRVPNPGAAEVQVERCTSNVTP